MAQPDCETMTVEKKLRSRKVPKEPKTKEKRGRKRMLPRDDNGRYYCEFCQLLGSEKNFSNYFARYIHIERKHKPAKIVCIHPNCDQLFRTHFRRDRHFITVHAKDVIGQLGILS